MTLNYFKGIEKGNSPWFNFSWEPTFASFGIYTRPLAYPQAIHYKGCNDRTYIVYLDKNFNPIIIFFDHDKKTWSYPRKIGTTTIGKNDHGAPSLAIDHGFIFVFWGAHNSLIKVEKTTKPEDISSWESLPNAGTGSYPQPYIKSDGEIHLFYRGIEKNGGKTRPCVHRISRDHGQTWTDEDIIIEFKNCGIYSNVVWTSDRDISISWFKWDILSSNSIDSRYNVYYTKSNDGGKTWKNMDNSIVSLPITELKSDVVFNSYPQQAYVWDLQISQDGIPVILFTTGSGNIAKYMAAIWDRQSWQIHEITTTHWIRNPGLIDIIGSDCIDAYLIKGNSSGRGGELQRYSSTDKGVSWKPSESLMSDSNFKAWAMQIVKDYHKDLKIIWSIGNMDPGHIVFEGNAPERIKISKTSPSKDIDPSETLEYFKQMTVHPSGILKEKIPQKAELNLTDADLEAFYSERYANVDVAEFFENEGKERLFGLCNMVKSGEFFLDVGCAGGSHMNVLYQRGTFGIGLDLAVPNILRGREKYPHLKFIHGFAEEIPFKDNFFDVVLLGDVVGHFRNPPAVLSECLRVARTGLVIGVPIKEEITEEHINPFNVDRIISLLDRFNLKILLFNPEGEIISKETAVSGLNEFPWLLIRAEKSDSSADEIKKYREIYSSEIENRGKTELLDNDQWKLEDFHSRDSTEIARFNLVSHLIEGNRVLEIGSGNGDSTLALSKIGGEVVGVDISETGIRDAYQYSKNQDSSGIPSFCIMDATALAFPDNTFDTVVIPEVIEHVRSSRKIFHEAIRVVRNGGRIIFSVPDGLLVPWSGHLRIFFKDTLSIELSQYSDTISWHDLSFKKWIIGSFFVKKERSIPIKGPDIDILMPSYNGRSTIERAIRSVIDQTYINWTLIIINDGGEDLIDLVEKFHDSRIKYITSEHKGKSHALNIGLQNSKGKYISYLDDDDILYPIHLEELFKGITNANTEFVYTDWYEVSVDNKKTEFARELEFRLDVTPDMLITQNYINHKCILHSRKLINEIGWYDEDLSILIDWDIIRRMAFKVKPVHIWSITSERIRYYNNNALINRISGLWTRDKDKAMESVIKIINKTDALGATVEDLTKAVKRAMVTIPYYKYPILHELDQKVEYLDKKNSRLENQIQVLDQKVEYLNTKNSRLENQIQELTTQLSDREQRLSLIENSLSGQFTMMVHNKIIGKILPYNTRRRRFFVLGLKGGRILVNEGWDSFWRAFRRNFHARTLKRQIRKNDQDPPDHYLILDTIPDPNKISDVNNLKKLIFARPVAPTVSIIIPVYNKWQFTYNCLTSILENTGNISYEVIIADDCSTDPTVEMLKKTEGIRAIKNEQNLGYLKNCNNAVKFANGQYLLFLNNDTYVMKGWLESLLEPAIKNDNVGIVGPNLIASDGRLLENGWIIRIDGWGEPIGRGDNPGKYEYNYLKEVDCVTGTCLLIKKEIFMNAGLFNEQFSPAYYEEFDFAFTVRKMGYSVVVQPKARVVHYDNSSYGKDSRDRLSTMNHRKFLERWGYALENRPAEYYDYFLARDNVSRKKVMLIIDKTVPDYDKYAGSLMMFQYVKLFHEMGFKVIFLPDDLVKMEPYTDELQQMGVEVIYGPFDFDSWILDNGKYIDMILLSRPLVSIKYIDKIKASSRAKIVYVMHDLHYLRELRRYEIEKHPAILEESRKFKEIEFRLFNTADIVLTFSNVEAGIISRELPHLRNIGVIPLFVYDDFPAYSSLPPVYKRQNLIFLGGFGHLPNADAVLWFVRECFPIILSQNPTIKFIIIGGDPPQTIKDLASENIIVTGHVKDLQPYFDNARVFVSPLRYGAGVKGKLITSMYYGVPIVTTTIGAEGLEITDGKTALVADDPADFASRVIELFSDKDLWEKLSVNSLKQVRNTYSKQEVTKKILKIFQIHKCHICGALYEFPASVDADNVRDTRCPQCSSLKRWDDIATASLDKTAKDPTQKDRIAHDNEGLICVHPFYSMLVFQNYNIYNCVCPDWIKQPIGNLKNSSLSECWNSEAARYIRRKMYAGEWQDICNPICPIIIEHMRSHKLIKYDDLGGIEELTPTLIDEIRARKDYLNSPPTHFKLDNSNVCNLHCIMCSREAFKDNPVLQKKFMTEFQDYLPSAKKLLLCGNGDPLARPDTREILMNHTGSIKFEIISNGLLLPKYWDKIKHQRFGIIHISVDAATKNTYEKIRAGGKWENLLHSLSLIKENRDRFEYIVINMTVMRSNYKEIPPFIDLAESYGFNVLFGGIRGPYPDENIFEPRDFRAISELKTIVAEETNKKRSIHVSWGDLLTYLNN